MAKAQKIQKWGNSLAVRIPRTLADQAGLSEGAPFVFRVHEDGLTIARKTRKKRKYTLEELVAKITPENRHELIDWGPPVGKEIW